MRLAEAAGVDLAALGDVVRHSDRVTGGPGAVHAAPTGRPLGPTTACGRSSSTPASLGEKDLRAGDRAGRRSWGSTCRSPVWPPNDSGAALGVPHEEPMTDDRPVTERRPPRARGKEQMKAVYGWDIDQVEGPFVESTVDHLFGEVWAEGKHDGQGTAARAHRHGGRQRDGGRRRAAARRRRAPRRARRRRPALARRLRRPLRRLAPRAKLNTEVEKLVARMEKGS